MNPLKILVKVKKYLIYCILLNAVFYQSTIAQNGKAPLDDAKVSSIKYAAVQATKEIIKRLKDKKIKDIDTLYSEVILKNLHIHKDSSESKIILGKLYKEDLQKTLYHDLKIIYKSFNPDSAKIEYFSENWLINEYVGGEKLQEQISDNVNQNYKRNFQKVFNKARITAATKQLNQLSIKEFPSVNDIEDFYKLKWSIQKRKILLDLLVEKMSKGKILLQENLDQIKIRANNLIDDAKSQFDNQLNALNDSISIIAITEEQIANELKNSVLKTINTIKKSKSAHSKIYDIFPSVKDTLSARTRMIETNRFKTYCSNYNYMVSPEKLKKYINDNINENRNYERSLEFCCRRLYSDATAHMINDYAGKITESQKASEFKVKLGEMLLVNKDIVKTINKNLESKIEKPLKDIRGQIAEQQGGKYFPTLMSGEWTVPENILVKIDTAEFKIKNFNDCLSLPGINKNGKSYYRYELLTETGSLVFDRMNNDLIPEGKNAWGLQLKIVKKYKDKINSEIKVNPSKRNIEEWDSYYIQEVDDEWKKIRIKKMWPDISNRSDYMKFKYDTLFSYTREEIKKIVKYNFPVSPIIQKTVPGMTTKTSQPMIGKGSNDGKKTGIDKGKGGKKGNNGKNGNGEKGKGSGFGLFGLIGGFFGEILMFLIKNYLIILLLILIILLIILIIHYLKRRGYTFYVNNLEKATNDFSEIVEYAPMLKSKLKAVFKLGDTTRIIFIQKQHKTKVE